MDTKPNSAPDRWSLYADPSIFQVGVRTTDDGWIQMMLKVDPESTNGVGICGTRLLSRDVANGDEPVDFTSAPRSNRISATQPAT